MYFEWKEWKIDLWEKREGVWSYIATRGKMYRDGELDAQSFSQAQLILSSILRPGIRRD